MQHGSDPHKSHATITFARGGGCQLDVPVEFLGSFGLRPQPLILTSDSTAERVRLCRGVCPPQPHRCQFSDPRKPRGDIQDTATASSHPESFRTGAGSSRHRAHELASPACRSWMSLPIALRFPGWFTNVADFASP